ncbi:MAG: tRNA glutamyl-Q(34) synthetase GluQRS [Chthoniobacterales bacterium]
MTKTPYRGRIAPSPTGYLHAGHAITFCRAQERSRARNGKLVLRIEDLDPDRCRPEFCAAVEEDLRWFGLRWDEGPDVGGPHAPYVQSERREFYLSAWEELRARGLIYPCVCSRRDVLNAAGAPHHEGDEPNYPGTCRPARGHIAVASHPGGVHWRFRVPQDEQVHFEDGRLGKQSAVSGNDFGDFVVWRKDDVPAYQLAVVVDDAAMQITEVVRGADLLLSTFRQLLIYRSLGLATPAFYHTPLVTDSTGRRLAKREAAALGLRALRETGVSPQELRDRHL